jgi:hypothetical protein
MAIVKILSSKDVCKKKGRLPQNRGKSSEKQHRGNHEKPTKTQRTFEKATRDLNKNLRKRSAKQHRRNHGNHEKSYPEKRPTKTPRTFQKTRGHFNKTSTKPEKHNIDETFAIMKIPEDSLKRSYENSKDV